ncbi:sulfotransferase domain-containing protein [Fragilaria crotonensis]|nr:sulfotransferase domain-containing protein [Fragilaria crotonensis]
MNKGMTKADAPKQGNNQNETTRSTFRMHNGRVNFKRQRLRKRSAFRRRMTRLCALLLSVGLLIATATAGNIAVYLHSIRVEAPVETFCKNSSSWANDVLWRTSVASPRVCPPPRGTKRSSNAQMRSDRQHLAESLNFRTPCGSHCAFHTDTLQFATPVVTGWQLSDPAQKGSKGCWEPIIDLKGHSCEQFYKDWAVWVEESNKGIPEPPCPECDAKRAAALATIPEKVGGRCEADVSWKKDSFWRTSVENPSICYIGIPRPVPSLHLGMDHLIETLASWTPCGSYCIFHEESRPKHAKPGSLIPPKVARKGWSLQDPDGKGIKGCFTPIEDVRSSFCNQWFKGWTKWVDSELVVPTASPTLLTCPACDQIQLPADRYQWDDVQKKAIQVPPSDSSTICGPRFLIVGARGCGTDTLGNLLLQHPRVKTNSCKDPQDPKCNADYFTADASGGEPKLWETHGLSHEFVKDPSNWQSKYARRLPFTDGVNGVGELTVDKSPSYFNTEMFPGLVARAKELLPNAKVVVSLCNPVNRLYHEFTRSASGADVDGRQRDDAIYKKHGVAFPTDFTAFVNMLKPGRSATRSPIYVKN